MPLILGKDGVNKEIKKVYLGSGGINKQEKELYLGKGGINKQIYSSEPVSKVNMTNVPLNGVMITFNMPFVFSYIYAELYATNSKNNNSANTTLELFLRSESNYYKIIMNNDSGYFIRPLPGEEPDGESASNSIRLYPADSNGIVVGNAIGQFSGDARYNSVYATIRENFLELNADVQWTMGHGPSSYPNKIPMNTFPNQQLTIVGYRATFFGNGTGSIQNLNIWGF